MHNSISFSKLHVTNNGKIKSTSQDTSLLRKLIGGVCPCKNFPWEETEPAFCKALWKRTPRIQILSKLSENTGHFTIKTFWLQKQANLSASLWKDTGKWSDSSLPQSSIAQRKSFHFPLLWDLTSSRHLALRSNHCLLPPAGRLTSQLRDACWSIPLL